MKNRFGLRPVFVSIFALAILLLAAPIPALAQTAPEKILSPADVSAYAANFTAIQDELDALGDKYDEYFPDAFDSEEDETDLTASIRRLRSVAPPAEIKAIMKKHGLGGQGFEKFVVISYCIGISAMETAYDMYASQYAGNAQMSAYLEEAKKNVEAMKSAVHPADLKLVASRQEELAPLLEMEDGEY